MKFNETVPEFAPPATESTGSETKLIEKNLPSRFLPYPKNTVVYYSPYTFLDIKKLSKSTLTKEDLFKRILSGMEVQISGKCVDPKVLTVSDFLFLALMRKLSSFGATEYSVCFKCSACTRELEHKFKLTDLEFEDSTTPEFPVCVELQGRVFEFSPTTVGEYLQVDKYKEIDGEETDSEILGFAMQVENMSVGEAYRILSTCVSKELVYLQAVDSYLSHALKDLPCECTEESCKHVNQIELDAEGVLIVPFHRQPDAPSNRISFGKRS